MTTFSHEVSPYRRRDGTFAVKIRMTHNRHTLRKSAGIYATADQLTRDRSRIRDRMLLDAVEANIARLRNAAATIEGAAWMDAETLWRKVAAALGEERGFRLDLYDFADTITATMERGTADGYRFALNAFRKYTGRDRYDINELDAATVSGFREWIEQRNGKGCRSASAYLEKLRAIHAKARERYNDEEAGIVRIPRQPFRKGAIPPQPTTRHRALTAEQVKAVSDCSPTTRRGRMAKEVFLLSFLLVGMNTADLFALPKGCVKNGLLTYRRAKTDSRRADNAEMVLRVEPEAAALIAAWRGQRTLLAFADMYADFRTFNAAVNRGLKEVGAAVGIPSLTSYHARHSWATIARNDCGLPFDTVHEALNHARRGGDRVTDIYLERDFSRVWEANFLVIRRVFG